MTMTRVAAVALAAGVAMLPAGLMAGRYGFQAAGAHDGAGAAVAPDVPLSGGGLDAMGTGAAPAPAPQFAESAADRMPMAEFKRLVDAGAVIVLDVRGTATYRDGHVPGSLSVPLDTVSRRAAEWKNETKPLVAYCS